MLPAPEEVNKEGIKIKKIGRQLAEHEKLKKLAHLFKFRSFSIVGMHKHK